jgi:excisionase family DNA binding protein
MNLPPRDGRSSAINEHRADHDQVLTVSEVATDLRCSKAHVYHVIKGEVAGVRPLPAMSIGRRRLVRRSTLETWKRANEHAGDVPDAMIRSSPEVDPADA